MIATMLLVSVLCVQPDVQFKAVLDDSRYVTAYCADRDTGISTGPIHLFKDGMELALINDCDSGDFPAGFHEVCHQAFSPTETPE